MREGMPDYLNISNLRNLKSKRSKLKLILKRSTRAIPKKTEYYIPLTWCISCFLRVFFYRRFV